MRPCKYRKERNMSISLTLHLFLTHPPSASQTHQARAPAPSHSPVRRSVYLPWLECTHRLLHRHIRLEHQHLFILPYADLCIFPGLSAPTICFTDTSGSSTSTFSFSRTPICVFSLARVHPPSASQMHQAHAPAPFHSPVR